MKKSLFLFLTYFFFSISSIAGGKLYISQITNSVVLDSLSTSNVLISESPILHRTYDCQSNTYTIKTGTNSECVAVFSSRIAVKINENTSFGIDSFDQLLLNNLAEPELAKTFTTNYITSLNGSLYVSSNYEESNMQVATIATDLVFITFKSAKFIIRSEDKSVLIMVFDGEITVTDAINSKKQMVVKSNNMLVVVPAPKFQFKASDVVNKKQTLFTAKPVDLVDIKEIAPEMVKLDSTLDFIKFIVIKGDSFGVKVN
jgi:hypothetical protein